jgi:hypothetical protein
LWYACLVQTAKDGERLEKVRLVARSAARDLLRLVRALDARGVELDTLSDEDREALGQCNQELATALFEMGEKAQDLDQVESALAESRARLDATRSAILSQLGRVRRAEVLEAMLSVEVVDEDLEVEEVASAPDDELHAARARAEQRYSSRREGERLRRREEQKSLPVKEGLARVLLALPEPWLSAIGRGVGAAPAAGAHEVARRLLDPEGLSVVLGELRPSERGALKVVLERGGTCLARDLERELGTADEDGFRWDEEPPTSVVGRLRARGLCYVGRAALGDNPRSRSRVVLVPVDLRAPLAEALARCPRPESEDLTVSPEIIDQVMEDEDGEGTLETLADDAEAEALRFDRAQPELASFAASAAEAIVEGGAMHGTALVYYVERVWAMFEAAHPGRVPRLRDRDIEVARVASEQEMSNIEVMHERLLERRVAMLVREQPNLYAFVAQVLDDPTCPLEDEGKAIVFHACDTAIRAFHAALLRK